MSELDLGTLRGHVELDIDKFETKYRDVIQLIGKIRGENVPDIEVNADVTDAVDDLERVQRETRNLPDAEVEVRADTDQAEAALDDVADAAGEAGEEGGEAAGAGLAGGILEALATIPIAGAVVGIGVAIGAAIMEGLANEVREDAFAAKTGLDATTAARFGRAAGEAYANNFGESIEGNLDNARAAVQSGLLDPNATARDAQAIIEQMQGVADILGEDVPRVARSAAQAIKTGIAKDAAGAFDLLVKSTQNGLNVSEDLLDTYDEYSTQFRKLGLDGPQAFGLIAQAVRAGARDTDIAADALKEFAIRATDGSELTAESFKSIGLNAGDMSDRIAAGGADAAAALGETLEALKSIEDPATRSALAVGLFGTQSEDMAQALYSMDLSTAVAEFGAVEGAAQSAISVMGDNTQGSIASATRNIELALDGLKGAGAEAFGPMIQGAAAFVTENREAVMQFLLDAANAAFDFARTMVNGLADSAEAVGGFVAGPAADLLESIAGIVEGLDAMLPGDQGSQAFREFADDAVKSMREVDDETKIIADGIRKNIIDNGIDPAQQRLNDFAIPLVAQAALHDASLAIAGDLADVGYAADGTKLALSSMNGTVDLSTEAGQALDQQLRDVVTGLDEQAAAGARAGESQEQLTERYAAGRTELERQLVAMGYTEEQAKALADQYAAMPGKVETIIAAETAGAQRDIDDYVNRNNNRRINVIVDQKGGTVEVTTGVGNNIARSRGGWVPGTTSARDSVNVHAAPGEFLVRADRAAENADLLRAINDGQYIGGYPGGSAADTGSPSERRTVVPAIGSLTINEVTDAEGTAIAVARILAGRG